MSFKRFLIWSSDRPHAKQSGTIYATLVEGIMGTFMCFFSIYGQHITGDGRWMHYLRRPITIAHLESLAQTS